MAKVSHWLLIGTTLLGACSPRAEQVKLRVYAASSTRDVLQSLEDQFEARHAIDIVFNFGSSSDLSRQISAAMQAEVFLSADEKEMDRLADSGLVLEETRRPLLSNQLVVIEPADNPRIFDQPFTPSQLAGSSVTRVSLADPETVPAGRYAKAWLQQEGAWDQIATRVLPALDVRAALATVESGSAQAGIVYATDAAVASNARVVFVVPQERGPRISYPVAVLRSGHSERLAREFVSFLSSPEATRAFKAAGFRTARE